MKEARTIGNNIRYWSELKGFSEERLSDLLCQSIEEVRMVLAGRRLLSFPKIEILSKELQIPVEQLLESNNTVDYSYAIDCMNGFTKESNREFVLDLIYDYLDVLDSVNP